MRSSFLGLLLVATLGSAEAVTLDFTNATCAGGQACTTSPFTGTVLDQSYGDIAGQVDVSHRAVMTAGNGATYENFLRFWDTGYAGLTNVAWAGHPNYIGEIRLTPSAGNTVSLTSLQLGLWPGGPNSSQVTIFDGNYNILSSSGVVTVGATPRSFNFSLNSASGLIIQWGPDANSIGIDNVVFSVSPVSAAPVPEPATYLFLLAGLGLVIGRMRLSCAATRV
jgi:hypothetical protein